MKGKQIADLAAFAREALAFAERFLRNEGYEWIQIVSGDRWASDQNVAHLGEIMFMRFEARRGPGATRRTPVERLVVRVRATGPTHKTLRASLVQPPGE